MFERNKIDNAPAMTAVPVTLTLSDGKAEKGRLYTPIGRPLHEHLNGTGQFLEFEPYGGERGYVAKNQVFTVVPIGIPKAPTLPPPSRNCDDFDPYSILGVPSGSDWATVRAAFVERTKTYHPDRFANIALPKEVQDYLANVARRINLAYETLASAQQTKKEAAAVSSAPISTSRRQV